MKKNTQQDRNGTVVKFMTIAGIVAATLVNFDGIALAQNNPQASPPVDVESTDGVTIGQWQSPIRVQPTLRDLPPGVAETETKRTKAQKEFDKKLQICRTC